MQTIIKLTLKSRNADAIKKLIEKQFSNFAEESDE
jgi:hypothetical protein